MATTRLWRRWRSRGADFTADPGADGYQPSVRMDSGTLFGVDASEVILWFNTEVR